MLNRNGPQRGAKSTSVSCLVPAWTVTLLVSDLPDAVWHALSGAPPSWLFWVKVGGLFTIIMTSWALKRRQDLRPFFIVLLILAGGGKTIRWLGLTPGYVEHAEQPGFLLRLAQFEGSRLMLAAIMVSALLIMGKRRQDVFLAKGDLKKWKRPGIILGLSLLVLTFLFLQYDLPSAAILAKVLPLLPAVICVAALAAFDEEVRCRATVLPLLQDVVGKNHSIMITAFYFGMGHYFGGVPSGIEGFVIAGALGWLWAAVMLETRGILMPWFLHFMTNVPTFVVWAMASVPR